MHSRKNKKPKPIDLLTLPEIERMKLIREVREQLRQTAVEAKLRHAFLEANDVTIDGKSVLSYDMPLKGLSLSDVYNYGC